MPKKMSIPKDAAGRREMIVELAAQNLFARRKKMQTALGGRTYGGLDITDEDAETRFREVKHDEEHWSKLLVDHLSLDAEGKPRISRRLVEAAIELTERTGGRNS